MNDRILIFGKGFIGEKIYQALGCMVSEKQINSFRDIESQILRSKPKIIINCIGHIGKRNTDDCELDKDKTLFSNSYIPVLMAEAAIRNKIKLVHISSGCIYQSNYAKEGPITETKVPDFFDLYYSRSKIYAERALDALSKRYDILIPRIRISLDNRPHPRNILTKLIRYQKAINISNSITYIPDFIQALKHLIKINARGVYNVVNKGGLRYPRLLEIYQKYVPDFKYEVIGFRELKLVRTNLVLSTRKLEKTGFKVRDINKVLEECVKAYVKY